jgi:hypothetical protein
MRELNSQAVYLTKGYNIAYFLRWVAGTVPQADLYPLFVVQGGDPTEAK